MAVHRMDGICRHCGKHTQVWEDGYCSGKCRRGAWRAGEGTIAGVCEVCGRPVCKPRRDPCRDTAAAGASSDGTVRKGTCGRPAGSGPAWSISNG